MRHRDRGRLPRLGGEVGTDQHRDDLLDTVPLKTLVHAGDAALELVHGRADESWGTVRLHLDNEQPSGVAVVHPNQSVDLAVSFGENTINNEIN